MDEATPRSIIEQALDECMQRLGPGHRYKMFYDQRNGAGSNWDAGSGISGGAASPSAVDRCIREVQVRFPIAASQ